MEEWRRLIKSFVVIFTNGKKVKNSIEHFYWVEEYVYHHGTHTIKKIIFDLYHSSQTTEYFPYGIHNIVIENSFNINNGFNVIFYHYYNCSNQRINISINQQKTDFYIIMKLLSSTYCIYPYLG